MANVTTNRSAVYWCRPTKRQGSACCVAVSTPPARPDPATYSQAQVIQQGQVPSWDSPDITTNNDIPWTLRPETVVVVRNLSATVAAVNTQIQVSLTGFGIGLPKTPLSTQLVTLPASGQLTLNYPLPQSVMNGPQSIGVFVDLYHPNDAVEINDHGSQVVTAFDTKSSGRHQEIAIPVANPSGAAQTITLAVLPNSVSAVVAPASHNFAPFEQIGAKLIVTVPAGLHNTSESVTVVAHDGSGALIGGATLLIWVND
jgi:hypothetical protein